MLSSSTSYRNFNRNPSSVSAVTKTINVSNYEMYVIGNLNESDLKMTVNELFVTKDEFL